jgi:hypothetical protein
MKKNYVLLLLAVFALVFTSCSKDKDEDEDESINSSTIEGRWKLTSATITYAGNTESIADESDNTEWVFNKGKIEAYEDGTLGETGTYKIAGNKLTISAPGEPDTVFTIDELTSTAMKLSVSETDSGVTYIIRLTFRKV